MNEDDYLAVLYFSDAMLSVEQVADVVHAVSQSYPQEELQGLEYVVERGSELRLGPVRNTVSSPVRPPRSAGEDHAGFQPVEPLLPSLPASD